MSDENTPSEEHIDRCAKIVRCWHGGPMAVCLETAKQIIALDRAHVADTLLSDEATAAALAEWKESRAESGRVPGLSKPESMVGAIRAALAVAHTTDPVRSRICTECGAISTEPYPVTVIDGQADPGMRRCPAGHVFLPREEATTHTLEHSIGAKVLAAIQADDPARETADPAVLGAAVDGFIADAERGRVKLPALADDAGWRRRWNALVIAMPDGEESVLGPSMQILREQLEQVRAGLEREATKIDVDAKSEPAIAVDLELQANAVRGAAERVLGSVRAPTGRPTIAIDKAVYDAMGERLVNAENERDQSRDSLSAVETDYANERRDREADRVAAVTREAYLRAKLTECVAQREETRTHLIHALGWPSDRDDVPIARLAGMVGEEKAASEAECQRLRGEYDKVNASLCTAEIERNTSEAECARLRALRTEEKAAAIKCCLELIERHRTQVAKLQAVADAAREYRRLVKKGLHPEPESGAWLDDALGAAAVSRLGIDVPKWAAEVRAKVSASIDAPKPAEPTIAASSEAEAGKLANSAVKWWTAPVNTAAQGGIPQGEVWVGMTRPSIPWGGGFVSSEPAAKPDTFGRIERKDPLTGELTYPIARGAPYKTPAETREAQERDAPQSVAYLDKLNDAVAQVKAEESRAFAVGDWVRTLGGHLVPNVVGKVTRVDATTTPRTSILEIRTLDGGTTNDFVRHYEAWAPRTSERVRVAAGRDYAECIGVKVVVSGMGSLHAIDLGGEIGSKTFATSELEPAPAEPAPPKCPRCHDTGVLVRTSGAAGEGVDCTCDLGCKNALARLRRAEPAPAEPSQAEPSTNSATVSSKLVDAPKPSELRACPVPPGGRHAWETTLSRRESARVIAWLYDRSEHDAARLGAEIDHATTRLDMIETEYLQALSRRIDNMATEFAVVGLTARLAALEKALDFEGINGDLLELRDRIARLEECIGGPTLPRLVKIETRLAALEARPPAGKVADDEHVKRWIEAYDEDDRCGIGTSSIDDGAPYVGDVRALARVVRAVIAALEAKS